MLPARLRWYTKARFFNLGDETAMTDGTEDIERIETLPALEALIERSKERRSGSSSTA